jgi:Ssp1 endopeptidase immunity protein Rap1a
VGRSARQYSGEKALTGSAGRTRLSNPEIERRGAFPQSPAIGYHEVPRLIVVVRALEQRVKGEVMMKRLVAAALLVFPGIAQAQYFDTGDDLWSVCTDNAPGHNYLCVGMSTAYFDMMLAMGYRCAAPVVERAKVRDAVVRYLEVNTGLRSKPASELAMTSLTTAFQCAVPPPAPAVSAKPAAKGAPIVITPDH